MPTKITRLSPTDAANNAGLPTALKRAHLESIEVPPVYWNLDPVRRNFPCLMGADPSLPLDLPTGSDEALISKILGECGRWEEQRTTCAAIGRALIDFRKAHDVRAARPDVPVTPYRSSADTIFFAENIVLRIAGENYLVALDLRSTSALTVLGREVTNSAIASRSRIADFRNMRIAILRTPAIAAGVRKVVFDVQPQRPRFDADQLDAMLSETYSIWELMLMGRRNASADGSEFAEGLFATKEK